MAYTGFAPPDGAEQAVHDRQNITETKDSSPHVTSSKDDLDEHDIGKHTGSEDSSTSGNEGQDDLDGDLEEGNVHDNTSHVLSSYGKLLSRRVDLVGDYAGNELFVIDGDSILLRCFSDERLDFDSGFQMLHAVYNVEQFLHNLAKRKCNFHVVFFSSNKTLCVPPAASHMNASKYLLARAAIILHLKAHLPDSQPDIVIHEFPSHTSPEFLKHLILHSPYFIMAHDGATSINRKGKRVDEVQTQELNGNRVALREMVLFFIKRGLNVALINGLEWRDTKVMAMVLERRRRVVELPKAPAIVLPSRAAKQDNEVHKELQLVRAFAPHFTERQLLAVLTVARVIKAGSLALKRQSLADLVLSFMVHQAIIAYLPLSARRLPAGSSTTDVQTFIEAVATCAESILNSPAWSGSVANHDGVCDLADLLDGRLFLQVCTRKPRLSQDMNQTLDQLVSALKQLTPIEMCTIGVQDSTSKEPPNGFAALSDETPPSMAVMPFSNPVFDKHLAPVRLQIDDNAAGEQTASSHRVFREITHWHNAKKPLVHKGQIIAQSEKQASWANKRNQIFMAEMQKYAASLTNAVGRSLEPQTIIVDSSKPLSLAHSSAASSGRHATDSDSTDTSSPATQSKTRTKKGNTGKKAQQITGKQAILNQISETKAKKETLAGDKVVGAWHVVCKGLSASSDAGSNYEKTRDYLASLSLASRNVVAAECELYMLSCLLHYWIAVCRKKEKNQHIEVAALIWNTCQNIVHSKGQTKEILAHVVETVSKLALPSVLIEVTVTQSLPSRKLGFAFAILRTSDDVSVGIDPKEFQLKYCGPYLERSFDSAPDERVDFQPDGWQRRILDAIDVEKSVFAVAPTSAGKTFISFYAMRKILEADDDGVLVYVAPTKALVNQIAAEIQARYSKKFKYGGKSVWAIHTRDYRINSPTGCQVLVTVPHVLQIMLLAPSNANSWSSRVKRIIFDEVHSIGQAEDGVVWEQLLLLAPCPIIALSATVGNPGEFSDWLASTQRAIGFELVTVQHPHRYSDLRKYYYVPPKTFNFQGLPDNSTFGTLGLEHAKGLSCIHPVAALLDRSRGIPEDIALEPRDCLELYSAMAKHATDHYPVPSKLDPKHALPEIIRKVDILQWECSLKEVLQQWIEKAGSPYIKVIADLECSFRDQYREPLQATRPDSDLKPAKILPTSSELSKWTLSLLCRLHEQNALPAILFNYDRHECETIVQALMEQLQNAELEQVKSGKLWSNKIEKWEEWKKMQENSASRGAKAAKKKAGKKGGDDDNETESKLDRQRDSNSADASSWDSFDPAAPVDGYHFANHSKVLPSEVDVYVRQLKRREVQQWLIDALTRGIGIHHAGMNRKYRQVVEILFRKGFLLVVVATGTLALGINMPCKTVVFSGDSVFLTALNYRQCAGRAGRRGFDLLGNVVFQDVSREKVCRLISSRLPDLNGHFPITTTLVLRLFTLLHESKSSKYAVSAINALLSQPRLFLGGPSFKDQTMHHLRFSIEYLRRQYLLGSSGVPLNFAGLVSHLYFTENSSFAFHALLKEGYFHELCAGINRNEKVTLETLMLVMAHLFNRIYCRQADKEYRDTIVKPSSSIVFLPPVPKKAANILRRHNQQTLDVYRTYVGTFVNQHITGNDRKMPLTGMEFGGDGLVEDAVHFLPAPKTRSAFVALSGLGDDFESISALCHTTREGVFLEEAVIPHVDVYPEGTDQPLNAWLLDFFKHGDVYTLERANGIRRSDIWFLLNDFSLVLATLIAALMGYMKLKGSTDMDMLDVMGSFDAHEEAEDEQAAASDEQSDSKAPSVADSAISMPERQKQVSNKSAKNADSWEDVADAEDAIARAEDRKLGAEAENETLESGGWIGEEGGDGLKNVLKAFTKLHADFNVKFRAMWA